MNHQCDCRTNEYPLEKWLTKNVVYQTNVKNNNGTDIIYRELFE